MDTTDHLPSHYDLHEFRYYYKDNELVGARRHCLFELTFVMEGKPMRLEVHFEKLMDASEKHAPAIYGYIKRLEKEIDATFLDYTELVEALEAEGFDFEPLVRSYLDHITPDRFYQVDAPPPELVEAATKVAEEIKAYGFDQLRKDMLFLHGVLSLIELYKCLFKAAKRLMNKSFVRLNEFDKKRLTELYDLLNHYTWHIAAKINLCQKLVNGDEEALKGTEATLHGVTPEGRKARILERRSKHDEAYPHAFSLEIVGMEDRWEVMGENQIQIYLHVVTEAGDAYLDVRFREIRDEACLYDPALYERMLELEGSIEAILPKEAEVVAALLAEGWDLMPMLYSYCRLHAYIKTRLICKRVSDKTGHVRGEYYEYLKRKVDNPTSNYCEWSKTCSIVESKLVKIFMGILEKDCPEVLDAEDYRITEWVVNELKVLCSNLFYDLKDEFSELHVGGVVWPDAEVAQG